jgi:hypothetical protein
VSCFPSSQLDVCAWLCVKLKKFQEHHSAREPPPAAASGSLEPESTYDARCDFFFVIALLLQVDQGLNLQVPVALPTF